MEICLIVAFDNNRVIGKNNDLPWSIPKDWQYVLDTIERYPLVMGRRTLESLDGGLPNHRNIVLTRNKNYQCEQCEIAHKIEEVFRLCKNEERIFIFGGEEIYRIFLPYVDYMYITKIDYEFEGDTFFPEFNHSEWEEVSVKKGIKDDENPYDYFFHIYKRKKPMEQQ